jgi:hypothetical protein
MTATGQKHALPHRSSDGRFTSMSRHYLIARLSVRQAEIRLSETCRAMEIFPALEGVASIIFCFPPDVENVHSKLL